MRKSYHDLKIWQKADEIFDMICADVASWPNTKTANVISYQLLDSGGSMSSNIAEGYGRGGPREFEQFLRYSRGSTAETDNWLYKVKKRGLISAERYAEYEEKFSEFSKMLASFIHRLREQSKRAR
jgi:four helix bundle protein